MSSYDDYDNDSVINVDNLNSRVQNTIDKLANNKILQKISEQTLILDAKYELAKQNRIEKELDLTGYKKGYWVFPEYVNGKKVPNYDGDSGFIQDAESNQIVPFRSKAYKEYDTADLRESVFGKSKRKPKWQPSVVAQANGKLEEQLTDEDYRNFDSYQFLQTLKRLEDPSAPFEKYDKYKYYDTPTDIHNKKIPIFYKSFGNDVFNRTLADIADPNSGKSIFEDFVTNPYMNTKFEEHRNLPSVQSNLTRRGSLADAEKLYDETTGFTKSSADWVGHFIDSFQAGIIESAARNGATYLPENFGGKFFQDLYDDMIKENYETGLNKFEEKAGMSPIVKHKIRKRQIENQKLLNEAFEDLRHGDGAEGTGKILKFIYKTAYTLPDILGTSFSQMLPAAAIGTVTGGVGAATGFAQAIGTTGRALGFLASGLVVGADNTSQVAQDYKRNNDGKEMHCQINKDRPA